MTTITGKIESAAGETLHAIITFTSRSTPQFPPTITIVNTRKRIKSNASTGEFSVELSAGNYAVNIRAKGIETNFNIAVPEGSDTISIEDLVTSTVSALPGEAPYTVWNGQRAGHLTFLPVADPAPLNIALGTYPGGSITDGESYFYAISYVTTEGETALSTVNDFTVASAGSDLALDLTFSEASPSRATGRRIWRNKDSGDPTTLYLLAELAPEVTEYTDWEGHADFSARAEYPPNPPTFNTTAGIIHSAAGVPQLYFSSTGLRALAAMQFDYLATFQAGLKLTTGAAAGYVLTSDADGNATWQAASGGGGGLAGTGSPEGAQTADPGQTYLNLTNESFWVKKTGTGNTGWIEKLGA